MKTDPSRAGDSRPSTRSPGRRERFELWAARIPWRVKLTIAYAVIGAVLVGVFVYIGFDTDWMWEHWWNIVRYGLPLTLLISVLSIVLATVLATIGAFAKTSRNPFASAAAGYYTSFFRGTPLIVQLFIVYFALPDIGLRLQEQGQEWGGILILGNINSAVIALGLNYGAYMTEIFRAGLESVAHGQGEAADALGMTYLQRMRRVVVPQAIRVIIPPTGNEFIAMLKDSALAYTIGVVELFRRADLAGRADFRSFEGYIIAALGYWALTGFFTFFQRRLERRVGRGFTRGDLRGVPSAAPAQPGIAAPVESAT